MATWYTDNLTGNDTTGDGTIANPYKSVLKAIQVGTDGDTVNVAGSGWTDLSGTLTVSANTTSITTSQDLTAEVSVGTVFSLKDPVMGNRTLMYKVVTVNATTITTNVAFNESGTFSAEKITTNHYSTAVTNTDLENLSAITSAKNNFNIQGGWTNNFTTQDGVTVFVYTPGSTSGTAFRGANANWLNGITLNNFVFVSLTTASPILSSVGQGTTAYLGNIWFSNTGFVSTNVEIFEATTGCNLSWNAVSSAMNTGSGFTFPQNKIWVINNLYLSLVNSGNVLTINNLSVKINNLWVKARNAIRPSAYFANGTFEIDNLNVHWGQSGTNPADNSYINLFSFNCINSILGYYNEFGFTSNYKTLFLGQGINSQIIAPLTNIDNWKLGVNGSLGVTNKLGIFSMVYDSEGQKQLFENTCTLFADSTVYDTGTNSLRISRTSVPYSTFSTIVQPPIKNVYIPIGSSSPITFTIRAKSTGAMNMTVGIQPVATSLTNGTNEAKGDLVYRQNFGLSNTWANFTYTLTGTEVASLAGSYIKLCIVSNYGNWPEPYLWIDSVTQS